MKAEQNELITRIGPGTACGALMRSYWQPVALVDEFDPALDPRMARPAGEGGARCWARTWCCSGTRRRLGPAGPRLPAPRRRPVLRPPRRRRPALPLPRLEVRRRPARASKRRPSPPAASCASACASAAIRCWSKSGILFALARRGGHAPPPFPALRLLRRALQPHLRLQGPVELQLAAGVRGRHRSGASLVPAPLPERRVAGGDRRQRGGQAVPQRQRRRVRRRALADDARSCASSTSPRSASRRKPWGLQLTALRPMTAGADARAGHAGDLSRTPS